MEKIEILKIGLALAVMYLFWILYRGSRVKKGYLEDMLSKTEKVKGQWDK